MNFAIRQASLLTLVEKLEVLVEKRNAIENKILDKSEQLEKVVKHAVDELTEVFDGRLKDLAKLKLGEHPLEPLKEPIVNASQDEEPLDPVFAEMLSKLRHGQ